MTYLDRLEEKAEQIKKIIAESMATGEKEKKTPEPVAEVSDPDSIKQK